MSEPKPRICNFNAGPAALPLAALERARDELVDFEGSGMSIMEHSHRGRAYERVHEEAKSLLAKLLGLSPDWEVLLVQGGASMAFATIPMNLLPAGRSADYVVTGTWGEKAVAEAKAVAALGGGSVRIAGTTLTNKTYVRVPAPAELSLDPNAAYLHCTSNETIHGVQYAVSDATPLAAGANASVPVIVDMSSDILARSVDTSSFSLIYAGAQKNLGPSGVTVVAIRKELVARGRTDLPTIFQFRTHAANASLYNTPPTFGIYLMRNVLSWLDAEGGVAVIEQRNCAKASLLYRAIDESGGFYTCPVEPSCRSIMNVVWRLAKPELDDAFVSEAEARGLVGLRGHRSVGGMRASLYNAVEPAWVEQLTSFMKDFSARRG